MNEGRQCTANALASLSLICTLDAATTPWCIFIKSDDRFTHFQAGWVVI